MDRVLTGKRILLGVSGSIAVYKAVELLRTLMREGAEVSVVMTEAATKFVAPLTFEVLSRKPVATDLFAAHQEMLHLTLPEEADVLVIAPATAHTLAKLALGLGDDLLSTMVLTASCPLIVAPAMDGGMWDHPTVQEHVAQLRARGVTVLDPIEGPLASGKIGKGRLTDEQTIVASIEACLLPARDLAGQRVMVSAGPTQEPIDPVRFLSNRSSGKMGYALAQAARERGADVLLVSGPTALPVPPGVRCLHVETAEDMAKALTTNFRWSTIVIMAAAVADFRPDKPSGQKIKKQTGAWKTLALAPTEDILHTLSRQRTRQILVGFAAETEALLPHARKKLQDKDLDLIVANDVTADGAGFGSDHNAATLLTRDCTSTALPLMPKRELADRILDALQPIIKRAAMPKPR
ncbi:MAG: phosphopantothenoylcysteine decarboxylase [Nitrospirae bacterium RIFCSPLOWO2_02_FULL_62_14]|nr:MAG: phosphopantothenoylcysteine decarboxylase [Nitrospirae bacterium RIFCSPLOWO2_02_FULL_62_14]OGW67736.1 MAG: phosphopantothenoylcysteine decarboxylase [Nitrospirae bacterium RIFCSPLOWO2_01_FULL_62_17]